MTKKLLFLSLMLMAFASNTFAQWYVYRNSAENPNWIRAYAGINYGSISETVNGQTLSFNPIGATVGAVLSPNLTFNTLKRMPLFLEVGAEFSYMYGHTTEAISVSDGMSHWRNLVPLGDKNVPLVDADGEEYPANLVPTANRKINMMTASIPVNLTYYFDFKDGKFCVAPFLGTSLKFNLMSQVTIGEEKYGQIKPENVHIFQVAVNAGVNVIIAKGFGVGYRFQKDIMHYAVNTTSMNHGLMFFYRF